MLLKLGLFLIVFLQLLTRSIPALAVDVNVIHSPGGIEAWFVHDKTVPLLSMQFAFAGGATQDPKDKQGLARFMAGLLDEGAGSYDSLSFHQKLQSLAITMTFGAGTDYMTGKLETLSANRSVAFDMLSLALHSPRFDAEAIERVRNQMLAAIRSSSNQVAVLASQNFYATAFPDHPYGQREDGTLESIGAITRDDIVGAAKNVLARQKLLITVVGDIDEAELGAALDKIFGSLPATSQLKPVAEATLQGEGRQIVIPQEGPQSSIKFGGIGIKSTDPDYIPAQVMNYILGGDTLTSRLGKEVREKRGLTYGIYTRLSPFEHAAVFGGSVLTRNEVAAQALQVTKDVLADFLAKGPTDQELQDAKAYMIGNFPLNFQTTSQITGQLLAFQTEHFTPAYLTEREKLIRAVTAADIKRVAHRILDKPLLFVIAGAPKGVEAN